MPNVSDAALTLAVSNIAHHGDTDIFPLPIENHLFHDKPTDVVDLLRSFDEKFDEAVANMPIHTGKELTPASYSGFRQGTQIDPIWNAYLLALVIEAGSEIEAKRAAKDVVFAYRFSPDKTNHGVFDKDIGWSKFRDTIKSFSKDYKYVLRCDIADFYSRIYHHPLENALTQTVKNTTVAKRITRIISLIAGGPSYGLPIGGNAARLLSELLLNQVDKLLLMKKVKFCRFVDDYVIFANSREEAQSALILLTNYLVNNYGLSLQKSKTKILTAAEFLLTTDLLDEVDGENSEAASERAFRKLRIHYDPYSQTAQEDYETLSKELEKYDIIGMLGRELAKSRIDETLAKRLINALKHLDKPIQNEAIKSITQNFHLLYPLFPNVMRVCRNLLPSLDKSVRDELFLKLRELISSNSYITQVTNNLAFALRVLAHDESDEADILIASCHENTSSMMIKRDIILIMANRKSHHWLSNLKNSYATLSPWEKRAMLVASYELGDEGKYFRDNLKKNLNPFDSLLTVWTGESKNAKKDDWRVPV